MVTLFIYLLFSFFFFITHIHILLLFIIDDFAMVTFCTLDPTDEDSADDVLLQIEMAIQFGEDQEPKMKDDDLQDPNEEA